MPVRVRSSDDEISFTVACKGLITDERLALYRAFREELADSRPAIRNPAPPPTDLQAIHEFIVHVTESAALLYLGKKVLDNLIDKGADIVADIIKRKLSENDGEHKQTVTIYGPNGKPLRKITATPEKTKPKR